MRDMLPDPEKTNMVTSLLLTITPYKVQLWYRILLPRHRLRLSCNQ